MSSLEGLPILSHERSRSISAENPTGEPGGGAQVVPEGKHPAIKLGRGWKARPSITLSAGSTTTLADIQGPGIIRHIWMTVDPKAYRECVLRCYWDGETAPSVEVPLGDFFANGHGLRYPVNSMMVAVNPSGGFNGYWPMPFRKRAVITIEHQGSEDFREFFYQISYGLTEVSEEAAQFHAQWRRSVTTREHPEHLLLEASGQGHYVGTHLAWTQFSEGWWGEGEMKFFLDGDGEFPTICGTGTEDYFGGAWCFGDTYSTPFLGYPLWKKVEGKPPQHGLYRWHVMDPVRFEKQLRVTIQALGWWPDGTFQPLQDDIASTAYWYQREPHAAFPALLPPDRRQSP